MLAGREKTIHPGYYRFDTYTDTCIYMYSYLNLQSYTQHTHINTSTCRLNKTTNKCRNITIMIS